jgi:hypothetical protein
MRKRLLVLVAALLLAAMGGLFLWLSADQLEAAHRRIHPGMDKDAVIAAVGKPPNRTWARPSGDGNLLIWDYGRAVALVVDINEDGRAVNVSASYHDATTLWQQLRAWWPW